MIGDMALILFLCACVLYVFGKILELLGNIVAVLRPCLELRKGK